MKKWVKVEQLEKDAMVHKNHVLMFFVMCEQAHVNLYYDIEIKDIKDFYFRPFFFDDDEMLLLNLLSIYHMEKGERNSEEILINEKMLEAPNWTRLQALLQKAERNNVSVFSVFYEWLISSKLTNAEFVLLSKDTEDVFEKIIEEKLSQYENADEEYKKEYKEKYKGKKAKKEVEKKNS